MIDLTKYAKKYYEEQKRKKEIERNEQEPAQSSVPSRESSTETSPRENPTVIFLEPNQPASDEALRTIPLRDITESNKRENSIQQNTSSNSEIKIKTTAAILSLILYGCSISLIVYGSTHFNDCPAVKLVPIIYIVMGCLMFFSRLLSSPEEYRNVFHKGSELQFVPQTLCRMCLNSLVQITIMVFFFILCYFIFNMDIDSTVGSPKYCDKSFYNNSRDGCIVALVLLGLGFILTCLKIWIPACK